MKLNELKAGDRFRITRYGGRVYWDATIFENMPDFNGTLYSVWLEQHASQEVEVEVVESQQKPVPTKWLRKF